VTYGLIPSFFHSLEWIPFVLETKTQSKIMKPNKLPMTLLILATLAVSPLARAVENQNLKPLAATAENPALMEPVKSVYDHYLKVQTSLAKDSLEGVPDQANAMAKAIKGDDMKMLSPKIAGQAEALAQAKDLESARKAFKPLSDSLIQYLADQKVQASSYNEAYCPMAKASWLQTGKKISNPYLGKSMPSCGEIKRTF
jgi:hypothetical protein